MYANTRSIPGEASNHCRCSNGPGAGRCRIRQQRHRRQVTALSMKWLKRILIALAVLLVIAGALPFFISLDDYIPRIEKEVSARLKEPVSIKSIKFTALPLPHVTIDGITVGKTDDIKVGKVTVTPDLFSLLDSTRVIKSIEIDSLLLTQKATDKIPVWTKPDAAKPPQQPQEPSQVRVESIRLD